MSKINKYTHEQRHLGEHEICCGKMIWAIAQKLTGLINERFMNESILT